MSLYDLNYTMKLPVQLEGRLVKKSVGQVGLYNNERLALDCPVLHYTTEDDEMILMRFNMSLLPFSGLLDHC